MMLAGTECKRCGGSVQLDPLDKYHSCLQCGWEDYGTPVTVPDEDIEVRCPGGGRSPVNAPDTDGDVSCPACGRVAALTGRGWVPNHKVMSSVICLGSMQALVRVVQTTDGRTSEARGCRGCTLVPEKGSTVVHMHKIRESPKAIMQLLKRMS